MTLELLVNPIVYHEYDTTICDDVTYSFGAQILDSTGTYVDTLTSGTGCDSVLTVNLTVYPTYDVVVDEQICGWHTLRFQWKDANGNRSV